MSLLIRAEFILRARTFRQRAEANRFATELRRMRLAPTTGEERKLRILLGLATRGRYRRRAHRLP